MTLSRDRSLVEWFVISTRRLMGCRVGAIVRHRRLPWHRKIVGLLGMLVIALNATDMRADNLLGPMRNPMVLPDTAEQVRGFTVKLEVGRLTSPGYVPARITFQSMGRFSADRSFVVRFRSEPELETPPQNGLVVDIPVTVSQGATSETVFHYLPKWSAGQAVTVFVMEEGRPLEGYDTFFGGEDLSPNRRSRFRNTIRSRRRLLENDYAFHLIHVVADDADRPDTVDFARQLRSSGALDGDLRIGNLVGGGTPPSAFSSSIGVGSRIDTISQNELPLDWRAYQRYGLIVMDVEVLGRLQGQPSEHQAILDWVLSGGSLVVYNAPSGQAITEQFGVAWTPNPKLEEVLKTIAYEQRAGWQRHIDDAQMLIQGYLRSMDPLTSETAAAGDQPPLVTSNNEVPDSLRGRQNIALSADSSSAGDSSSDSSERDRQLNRLRGEIERLTNESAELERAMSMEYDAWSEEIQIQEVGAGYVIAIKGLPDQAIPSSAHWIILTNFLDFRASPTLRRGVDPLLGDRRFSRWVIPGVAQPPVYTFMGLLTAFVILVGPVAYRRTTRLGRSYLMFAIAPVLALLTTIAMFGYGIVSDGFDTTVRVRQLTWVDGKSGHAGERVRSTYFAGLRPTESLEFSGNSELMVYREGTGQSWEDLDQSTPGRLGRVMINNDSQLLDPTFLPSRQQTQFVAHLPRRDVGFLKFHLNSQAGESPKIESGFQFPIRSVVVRDRDARYWTVERLDPGEISPALPLETREASKLLGQLYNDHRPLSEVRERRSRNNRYDDGIYDVALDINRALGTKASVTEGVFELWLQQHLQTNVEIPNEHFVAITEVSPDVIAIPESVVNSSIRYVFGTFR